MNINTLAFIILFFIGMYDAAGQTVRFELSTNWSEVTSNIVFGEEMYDVSDRTVSTNVPGMGIGIFRHWQFKPKFGVEAGLRFSYLRNTLFSRTNEKYTDLGAVAEREVSEFRYRSTFLEPQLHLVYDITPVFRVSIGGVYYVQIADHGYVDRKSNVYWTNLSLSGMTNYVLVPPTERISEVRFNRFSTSKNLFLLSGGVQFSFKNMTRYSIISRLSVSFNYVSDFALNRQLESNETARRAAIFAGLSYNLK